MDVSLATDRDGRLICSLRPQERAAVLVTAADAALAGRDLLETLDEVDQTGYGECVWREAGGDYRWMFRRRGLQVTVVALWSTGTLTGWQHVLQVETDFGEFARQMRAGLLPR